MNIQVESQSSRRIIHLNGKITFEYCPVLQNRLDAVSAQAGVEEIVLDFRQVPFIDSSGVGEILRLFKRVRELEGEVVLMNPNRKLRDLFLMYRLDRFMNICKDTDLDKD
jgi:anti-anti-sigma factor